MRFKLPLAFSQERLVGGALVLAATQLGASVMGLVRERTLNQTFPDLDVVDVYISSFRLSDLLFQVCIMAGYSVALVPLLAKYHAGDDKKKMGELLGGVMGIAALVFGVLALVLAAAMPWLAPKLVGFEGESLELYITYARLALVTNFLFVFGNAFGQYLITIQRYWIYGITPMLYTLGTILGTMFLSTPDTFGSLGPMAGTVIGAFVYVVGRMIAVAYCGTPLRLSLWHADLPELARLMVPRMVALGALQMELLIFDTLASGLPAGSVTINANARNFQAVAVGVAGIALAQSAFSPLSQAIARGDVQRFWWYLKRGTAVLLGVTLPGAVVLVFVAPLAAFLVGLDDRLAVFRVALLIYAISIPFESVNHLLLRAYYAAKDSITPAFFSVLNGGLAIVTTWVLAPKYGIYALPIGFTLGQVMHLIGLAALLPQTIEKAVKPLPLWKRLYKKIVRNKNITEVPPRELDERDRDVL